MTGQFTRLDKYLAKIRPSAPSYVITNNINLKSNFNISNSNLRSDINKYFLFIYITNRLKKIVTLSIYNSNINLIKLIYFIKINYK